MEKNKYADIDISETNIANLGTELESKIKEAAAQKEPAWNNVGKKMGLTIWRIEKFHVNSWPETDYGQFYKGDSYIVLETYKVEEKICFNVHFWLGLETTQDESGTAAYKTTELSDYIHGNFGARAVHYREVQGEESDLFDKYFGDHLFYLEGGIASGFHHVEAEKYEPRLLHLKGRRKVKAWQVPIACSELNSGDIFIYDGGEKIIQWNGTKSNQMEKFKAAKFVQNLESLRLGKAKGDTIDEYQDDDDVNAFYSILGGTKADVQPQSSDVSDEKFDKENTKGTKTLFRINEEGTFDKVCEGEDVANFQLDGDDIFVLDYSGIAVYEWVGSGSSKTEKGLSFKLAMDYLKSIGKPKTSICRVYEGHEHKVFWDHYKS